MLRTVSRAKRLDLPPQIFQALDKARNMMELAEDCLKESPKINPTFLPEEPS